MKKHLLSIAIALTAVTLTGCEDMLNTENYIGSNTGNFPSSIKDAEMMVTSIYSNLNHQYAKPMSSHFMTSEIASDDRFGGGILGDQNAIDHLMMTNENQFGFSWELHYKGIYLANAAIEGLTSMSELATDKTRYDQLLGESYFLRAFYYYELATMFGSVPLLISTQQDSNSPRAEIDQLWARIGSDLMQAINLMVNKKYNEYVVAGHATKWAAEALLARSFLFYTGFYQKNSMPLVEGSLSKQEVISHLEDCIAQSGHNLVGDYRNLWTYTNEHTVNDYAYTADATDKNGAPLKWAGNDNIEEVFSIKFANFCGYDYENQEGYSNYNIPYFGFLGANGGEETFPFGNGNGWGSVSPSLWDEWEQTEPTDIRRKASILRTTDEIKNWQPGGVTGLWEDTGFWQKKLMPVLSYDAYAKIGVWVNSIFWCAVEGFDVANNYGIANWGAHFQNLMVIRFADVLLMHSELTSTADGLNRVRQRAGLNPVGYSLEALQRERRHELCFEGIRWNDIRRWHIAEQALSEQNGTPMNNVGRDVVMHDGKYSARYQATQGFFPLPIDQINLSNGVLTQNEGWGSDAVFTTWNFE